MLTKTPFYDPKLSYEDNYHRGPFGLFSNTASPAIPQTNSCDFLGQEVNSPFGIPAGPLLNSKYIEAAFRYGFDICVYKTVRSQEQKCHPLPNVLAVHPQRKLSPDTDTVLADCDYSQPLSITNSFGVPSFSPDIWQPDMAKAVQAAGRGQTVIGSFQGTQGNGAIENDYALTAFLVSETKAPILEANLSCPNEGIDKLICFNIEKTMRIVLAIKESVPDKPLIIKLAYFSDDNLLLELINKVGHIVDGFSTINTLPARPVDHQGKPVLSENRPESGICGEAIRWAGLDMVSRLATLRERSGIDFAIVGVGGISGYDHYKQFLMSGADAVMSATGAMWNPTLAFEIKMRQIATK